MRALLILTLFALTACGADGPPVPPTKNVAPGIHISGEVKVGLVRHW